VTGAGRGSASARPTQAAAFAHSGALRTHHVTRGYAAASVAEIIRGARVPRETSCQQLASKQDWFSAALDGAIERLLGAMAAAVDAEVDVQERARRRIGAYLDALAEEPTLARMFSVEVYAASPDAVQRRVDSQQRVALW